MASLPTSLPPSSASREELRAEAAADAEAMLAERQRDFIARMMT